MKPEVQEKKPIVQPEKKENPNLPVKVTTPKKNSTETPPLTSPKKLTEPSEITGVRSVTVQDSFDPEPQSSNGDMPSKDDPPSKLKLNPHPALSIPKNSTLFPVGKSATIDVQFAATCPVSTGTVCDATQVKLRRTKFAVSYSGPASTQSPKDLEDIDKLATDILSKASVQSLTIETSANGKPDTFWSITFTLR